MMWGRGDHDMTWMGVTVMVLVIVLIAAVVLLLVRLSGSSRSVEVDRAASAHEMLAHRLAKGEITVEQYEVIRDALRRGAGS